MAANPSTYLINLTLNDIKTTPYVALYTSNPGPTNTGTEVSGGSYSRKSVTFGSITGGTISNTALVTFTGLPSATITHYGILDASTGGNLKAYGALNSSVASFSNDEVYFPIGNISISFSGS